MSVWKKQKEKENEKTGSYCKVAKELLWDKFLSQQVVTPYDTPLQMELRDWVCALFYNGIVPELEKKGYDLGKNKKQAANEFMNLLFQFHRSWKTNTNFSYIGNFAAANAEHLTLEDEDYFFRKCDDIFWNKLKKDFAVSKVADESDFAIKLWEMIPIFVFEMINKSTSNAVQEMEELLAWLDEDEGNYISDDQTTQKKDIDPYLQDYWNK